METWQKKVFYLAIGTATVIIALLFGLSFSAPYLVKESCSIEAGRVLSVDNVVENSFVRLFSSVQVQPDNAKLGKQDALIRVGAQKVKTEVTVRDRIAPKVTLREVSVLKGNICKADEFIVSIEDATATTLEYVHEPFFEEEGIQKVKIKVTDSAGNTTVAETKLIVVGV